MAEHLDFDKELLAKKGPYQIGHMDLLRTLARMRRRSRESYVCDESVGKVRKGSLLAVKVETL